MRFKYSLGFALVLAAAAASAQEYPNKPITLIVPFAPGASADGIGRLLGNELAGALGQPVIVENKPGGGGAIGLMALAKTQPDGYTLSMGATGAIVVNPHLPNPSPLKPQEELTPVAKLADIPLVVVANAKSKYHTLQDLLQDASQSEAGVSFANTGQYTAQHLAGELLGKMAKAKLVAVPYRGSGPAVTDLLGGQMNVAVVDLTSAYQHVKAGTLRALAVTSEQRSKAAPEIPTVAESGVPDYSAPAWMGLFAPANLPADIKQKLSDTVKTVLAKPDVQEKIAALSAETSYLSADQFSQFITAESNKWKDVIAAIGPTKP